MKVYQIKRGDVFSKFMGNHYINSCICYYEYILKYLNRISINHHLFEKISTQIVKEMIDILYIEHITDNKIDYDIKIHAKDIILNLYAANL